MKKIAVIGATGGLGTALVHSLQSAGYHVRGIVREESIPKAQELFPNIEIFNSNPDNLINAFNGMDIIVEVVSNSLRPHGIKEYIHAAEVANISTFIVCGGAFGLFINNEKTLRVIDVIEGNENYRSMNDMHLAVQEIAFRSTIPVVFQICPPYMPLELRSYTGDYIPVLDIAAGVNQVGYEDVASCIVLALDQPELYNRGMMGIGRK